MDFIWTIVKILAALVLVAVLVFFFAGIVAKAFFDEDLTDLFGSKQKIILGWSSDINSDRTATLTWNTKEKEIDFVVYEMHETKPESEPSEPKYEFSSINPVKPKTEKEKWTWTSSKLQAGSNFFVIVPLKDGEEIGEESTKDISANFFDDNYVELFQGKAGGCSEDDCGVLNCKRSFIKYTLEDVSGYGDGKDDLVSRLKNYASSDCEKDMPSEDCEPSEINEMYSITIDGWAGVLNIKGSSKESDVFEELRSRKGFKFFNNLMPIDVEQCRAKLIVELGTMTFSKI